MHILGSHFSKEIRSWQFFGNSGVHYIQCPRITLFQNTLNVCSFQRNQKLGYQFQLCETHISIPSL
uniref:Uncharacterized protein n=1 Tax=Arundo donax TaxID=35708 RepID=A0A0A8YX25_ARUDO